MINKPSKYPLSNIGKTIGVISIEEGEREICSSSSNAFHTLYEFYQDQILCDVEIVCDNQTFLCHKVVLAATIPYFRSMFTLGMLEADKRRIEIQDINRNSLKTIIEFAYTAKAIITIENVQHLLFASTVLQTEDLAEACSGFLRQHLSLTNCTEIRQYAELLNRKSLIDLADEFIRDHFLDIIQIDDFFKISYKHLKVNCRGGIRSVEKTRGELFRN